MPTHNNRPSTKPDSKLNLSIANWGGIRERIVRAQGRYMVRTGKTISTREFVVYMLKTFLDLDEKGKVK